VISKGARRPRTTANSSRLLATRKSILAKESRLRQHVEDVSEDLDERTSAVICRLEYTGKTIASVSKGMLALSEALRKAKREGDPGSLDARTYLFLTNARLQCDKSIGLIGAMGTTVQKCMKESKDDRTMALSLMREAARMTETCVKFQDKMECMRSGDVWYNSQGNSSCSEFCLTRKEGVEPVVHGIRKESVILPDSMWNIYGYDQNVDLKKLVDPRNRKGRKKKKNAAPAKKSKPKPKTKPKPK